MEYEVIINEGFEERHEVVQLNDIYIYDDESALTNEQLTRYHNRFYDLDFLRNIEAYNKTYYLYYDSKYNDFVAFSPEMEEFIRTHERNAT